MHCINISHPDFKALQEDLNINPEVLKAKVSVWMDNNTAERFPTAEELNKNTIFYSKQNLNPFQKQAADIYWNHVYNKNLSDLRIEQINKALKEISDFIGDEQWRLQLSKNDKFYIAGYNNRNVLFEDYYSPYANGMFRQMSSKTTEEKNTKLEKALFDWAKIHGISINALEVLINKYKGRYETGILGVADFANALIGLAENRTIDTLPEEVAHFAIELMANDPSMIRALETVDTTELYDIVKEEYKNVYTEEIDFRKEAVAKILAQEIISEFKSREDVPQSQRGFWTFLQAAAQKFVNWVRNNFNFNSEVRQDFEALVRPLAISILDNQYLGEFGVTETKAAEKLAYQLDPEEEVEKEEAEEPAIAKKKAFLNEVILQLSDRMNLLKRGAKSQVRINSLEAEISKLQYQLAKGELDLGIASFIRLAESEIKTIDDSLKNARLSRNINPTTLVLSENFMQMYENIFGNFIEAMYDENIPSEETEELRKMIHNLSVLINDARGINRMLMKKVTRDILEEANTDAYGNKIDPDFDPDIVSQDTHEDVSFWRLQVGNYKYADSKIIKAAHKIIFNSLANVKRFTVQKGNDLVKLQDQMFRSGGKIEDLIEVDKNGKYTHYFVQEYKWSEYYKAMNETKAQIAEALGFENYNQIQKVFLTPDQLKLQKTLWGKFYSQHTAKKRITTDQGLPLDITVPNDSYKDPRFAQAMKNPATKAYYEELIRSKKEAVEKLPVQYRSNRVVYMVPPILKSTLDRLTNKEQSFLSRVAQLGREALFIDQDETQFGQLNVLNNKMVPIYFTRPLDNITDLSFDVARSVTLFSEMAENFQEMNKIAGPLGSLQYSLAERNYFTDKKGTQRKKGIESKEYQALETLLDTHVFGIERDALASGPIPENKVTKALGIEGKQFSWSKASQRFAGFIRNNNLALNFPTSLSGWLKGSGDSIIEDQIGLYTTNESKNWARVEFSMNLFDVLGQVGKTTQTNKMHLIMQENEVVDINKMLSDTTRNRATRTLLNRDLLYVTFASGDYGLKGRITLSIYDNYRLYNGQFMTRAKFFEKTAAEKKVENNSAHQKEMSAKWKELREQSLYNAYEVVDGKLQIKPEFEKYINKTLLNSVKGKVDHVTTYIDGTLSKTDKGKLARTIAGDFLLMHRGWFIGLVDTRFKRESTNMLTEEEEIGTYRATLGFLYTAFYKTLIKDKAGLSASFATWNNLSPAKKRGVMKTGLDLLYLNLVAFLAALMNTAADEGDDDDWTLQFTAYQLNRLLLEQGSAWSPAELVQMIDEPVVGARMIRDLLDIKEAFNFDEVYESGMYEDRSHAEKWWMRKLPTRNLYEMQYPELKNRFIKTMVDSEYYDAMTDEQKHSIGKKASFFEDLFPTGILSDPDDRPEVITQVIEDLEEEQEEENGFN
jgi:predicted nucleic-acid-binding Zn-ribbon protein